MRVIDMNWMQVEDYLKGDDRAVLPIGSIEQHGYLSLGVDSILPERVAVEAAEPLGVPVFPTVNYGVTPYFMGFPGSISMRISTLLAVVGDVLDGIKRAGFKRVLIVNGHGGNNSVGQFAQEWMAANPTVTVRFHNWWNAPKTWARVQQIDPVASHASWLENFPWTRLPNIAVPSEQKRMIDTDLVRLSNPEQARKLIGDGNFGGDYRKSDEEMLGLWSVAVAETRELIQGPWA
jgi:creatinine amidohydrolase